ncbi:MAG: DNA recombination protein RmuC [Rhodospirillales bacterium]
MNLSDIQPEQWVIIVAVAVGAIVVLLALVLLASGRSRNDAAILHESVERLAQAAAISEGRMAQMSDMQQTTQERLAQRFQEQERALGKKLEEQLQALALRVGQTLEKTGERQHETMTDLQRRLAVIDAAQKNITELSSQVVGLQDILANKQTRGAFGETQLNDLVTAALPPSAYEFQVTLSNRTRADCLLKLPNPPGSIVIDAKFPLESYNAIHRTESDEEKKLARRAFGTDVLKHVKDISEKYILPGETAESALMFIPSEAVYAELYANHEGVVTQSHRARVWIVSPTTLMATLNTVRAVLKDAQMRDQAGLIQKEVIALLDDVRRLDDRVGKLDRHFDQTKRDIEDIQKSTRGITRHAERIEAVEMGEEPGAEELEPPKPRITAVD